MVDLVNASSCAIFSCNDVGIILQVNNALCRLVDMGEESLLHQNVNRIFTIPTQIFYQTHLFPLIKVGKTVDEIFISLKSNNGQEIPVVLSGQRVESEGAAVNVFSCLTIHKRSSYEAEIIAARKEAEQALAENSALVAAQQKLLQQVLQLDEQMRLLQQFNETLKEISHAVTHELQEPVRKLLLYTDMLANKQQEALPEKDKFRLMRQIEQIRKIVAGLQSYMWLEEPAVKDEQVDLAEVLQTAKNQLVIEQPGQEILLTHSGLPKLMVSEPQFTMLFHHLLDNSIKFRSPERPLQVHVAATVINKNLFQQMEDQYAYSAYYKIDYSDNGSGFDPRYGHHIFQLFRQLDKSTEGSGIGLALVKKIVLHHQGNITAMGVEGAGSTFTLYLPVNT